MNSSGFVSLSLSRAAATLARRPRGAFQDTTKAKRRVPPPSKRAELRATLTVIATSARRASGTAWSKLRVGSA